MLGFDYVKTGELMNKYPYFMGFFQGRDIEDLNNADAYDLFEALDEFKEAAMINRYSDFLCDAGVISEELISYCIDYSQDMDILKMVNHYNGTLSMDIIIDMLIDGIDYNAVVASVNKVDSVDSFSQIVSAAEWGLALPEVSILLEKADVKVKKKEIEELIDDIGEEVFPMLKKFINKLPEKVQNELNEKYF